MQSGYMLSVKAAVSLANFLVIIPFGLKYLTENRGVSKPGANLIGMRVSVVFLGVGALAISLSIKLWIFIPGGLSPKASTEPPKLTRHSNDDLCPWVWACSLHTVSTHISAVQQR